LLYGRSGFFPYPEETAVRETFRYLTTIGAWILVIPLDGGQVAALPRAAAEKGAREGWLEGYRPEPVVADLPPADGPTGRGIAVTTPFGTYLCPDEAAEEQLVRAMDLTGDTRRRVVEVTVTYPEDDGPGAALRGRPIRGVR
jgi:hypothetical protein